MSSKATSGLVNDGLTFKRGEPEILQTKAKYEVFAKLALTLSHRTANQLDHGEVALDRSCCFGPQPIGPNPGNDEVAEHS